MMVMVIMMAHFAKYKWHEYVGLIKNDRTKHDRDVQHPERADENTIILTFGINNKGQLTKYGNKNIHWNNTDAVLNEVQLNKESALTGVKVLNRSNVNHVVSLMFTCPEDVKPEDQKKCLLAAVAFMVNHKSFGGPRCFLLASLHFDETNPHVTYDFCPVTADKRLSAKDVLTKTMLQRFHSELNDYIDRQLGYHVSVENGRTKTGNKSINRLKEDSYKLKEDSYKEEIRNLKNAIKGLKSEVNFFRNGMDRAEAFVNAAGRLGVRSKIRNAVVDSDYPGEAVLNSRYDIYHQQRVDAGKKRSLAIAPAGRQ